MQHYEIIIILHPNQSRKVPEVLKRYEDMVKESGGTIHRLEDLGRKVLAYPIKKVYKGHYILMNIECSKEIADKLDYNFRFNDIVMRSLIVIKKKAETEPSIMMQKKEKEEKEKEQEKEKT